jgi:uncharacterized protein YoxC
MPDVACQNLVRDEVTLDDVFNAIVHLTSSLDSLHDKYDVMVARVQTITDNIEPHLKEVAPLIDAIANHPMFRMFTGTKKRKEL